jgi:hypothetical protein
VRPHVCLKPFQISFSWDFWEVETEWLRNCPGDLYPRSLGSLVVHSRLGFPPVQATKSTGVSSLIPPMVGGLGLNGVFWGPEVVPVAERRIAALRASIWACMSAMDGAIDAGSSS